MKRAKKTSQPTHAVYVVEGEGDNAFWTKIGAAWAHEDSEGFSISLIAIPMTGRLVLRKPKPPTSQGAADEAR